MEPRSQAADDARDEREWEIKDEELDRISMDSSTFSSNRSGPTTQGGTFVA